MKTECSVHGRLDPPILTRAIRSTHKQVRVRVSSLVDPLETASSSEVWQMQYVASLVLAYVLVRQWLGMGDIRDALLYSAAARTLPRR